MENRKPRLFKGPFLFRRIWKKGGRGGGVYFYDLHITIFWVPSNCATWSNYSCRIAAE